MAEEFTYGQAQAYLTELTPARPPEMLKMEAYAAEHRFPIIGPAAGHACYLIARMIDARSIFEMGSGYGYSTAWFAKAVRENGGGRVHHVVWDEQLSGMAQQHLSRLGYADLVEYHVGEAVEALQQSKGGFDFIFNDIDKEAYPASLPVIAEKLRPGGVLIVDNMLYHGRIWDESVQTASTKGVRAFTDLIFNDPAWSATILPIRDGLLLAYKR
ncbi:MAG: O-methyltransferase [Caldilineales bacterium]|nr:O-methyltransferase [Caldilineales bacterium]